MLINSIRINFLRELAAKHRSAAKDARRYEVYFAETHKARQLDGQADQLAAANHQEAL